MPPALIIWEAMTAPVMMVLKEMDLLATATVCEQFSEQTLNTSIIDL